MSEVTFTTHLKEVTDDFDAKKLKALEMCGIDGEAFAVKQITANKSVVTGNLRNSISHAVTEEGAVIGTNVEYAPYVELGTSRAKAKPFLKPAVADHLDHFQKIFKSVFDNN